MSIVITDDKNYSGISAAIREKNGTQKQYKPSEMADAIKAIPSAEELQSMMNSIVNGSVESIVIGEGVNTIRQACFSSLKYLTTVAFPASPITIGASAFNGCSNLKRVTMPNVTSIAYGAFKDCKSLTDVLFPETLTSINSMAFYNCSSLTLIDGFPSRLIFIGDSAFSGCTSLTSVTFHSKPTSTIYGNIFRNCLNLTILNVPWAEGEVANAPWGATNATINYNYTGE